MKPLNANGRAKQIVSVFATSIAKKDKPFFYSRNISFAVIIIMKSQQYAQTSWICTNAVLFKIVIKF